VDATELTRVSREMELLWRTSFLGELPEALSSQILQGATIRHMAPADLLLVSTETQRNDALYLLADGLVRVFVVGPDGRQATVRYAGPAELIGLPPLLALGMNIRAEAVTNVTAMRLDSQRFIALAQRNVELAWILARFLAAQVSASNEILAADVFLSVRARIARHLLDLAQRQPEGLVVAARHQHLADAIGSVREVVSREMRQLAQAGVIRRIEGGTLLEDPAELHRIAAEARARHTRSAAEETP
jgi:CRP/FNR family transcriptional regulator, cyclic AMP receptor protein